MPSPSTAVEDATLDELDDRTPLERLLDRIEAAVFDLAVEVLVDR